jgi:hypothetical protein
VALAEPVPIHLIILFGMILTYPAAIWALIVTAKDPTYPVAEKVVWSIELAFIPVLGVIVWAITRAVRRSRSA